MHLPEPWSAPSLQLCVLRCGGGTRRHRHSFLLLVEEERVQKVADRLARFHRITRRVGNCVEKNVSNRFRARARFRSRRHGRWRKALPAVPSTSLFTCPVARQIADVSVQSDSKNSPAPRTAMHASMWWTPATGLASTRLCSCRPGTSSTSALSQSVELASTAPPEALDRRSAPRSIEPLP